jgi:hypothetical protein
VARSQVSVFEVVDREGQTPLRAVAPVVQRGDAECTHRAPLRAGRNIEVVWLLGRLAPNYKTIANFRRDNGLALRRVYARFVELCRQTASKCPVRTVAANLSSVRQRTAMIIKVSLLLLAR